MSDSFPESKLNRVLIDFDEVVVAGTSLAKSRSTRLSQGLNAAVSIEPSPHEMAMRIEGIGPGKGIQQLTHQNGLIPRCRPWDYADFSCRLGSFTTLNWFARPAEVSPMQCARHGWRNNKRNGLICDCCLCEVDASGSFTLSSQDLHLLHSKLCPWKGNACPLSFLNFPILSKPELRGAVKKRLCSLLRGANGIQDLPVVSCPKLGAWTTEQLAIRASKLLGNTETTSEATDVKDRQLATALTLALCGWYRDVCGPSTAVKSNPHSDELVLRCNICNRRIGAWNFLSIDKELGGTKISSSDTDQQLNHTPSHKHTKVDKTLGVMDPVREHHTYCPWAAVHPHISEYDTIDKSSSFALSILTSPRAGWEWASSAILDNYSDSEETKSLDFTEEACVKASHIICSLVHH